MFERKSSRQEPKPDTNAAEKTADTNTSTGKVGDSAGAHSGTGSARKGGITAVIGAKVKIKGDIIASEDLLVEGEVNGTITLSDNELVVGTSGTVNADISAKTVRIEGEVTGDIEGKERVVICASGNVEGNVNSPRVMLEDGGRFKGSIDMGGPKAAPAAKPAPAPASEVHSIDKAG
jgi:cytoskeletal protein CcmA (bactofilin family)